MIDDQDLDKTPDGPVSSRHIVAASLAGGIMASSGLPHTMPEALAVFADVFWTLYPDRGSEHYTAWAEGSGRRPGR